jgi:hypothetical protein
MLSYNIHPHINACHGKTIMQPTTRTIDVDPSKYRYRRRSPRHYWLSGYLATLFQLRGSCNFWTATKVAMLYTISDLGICVPDLWLWTGWRWGGNGIHLVGQRESMRLQYLSQRRPHVCQPLVCDEFHHSVCRHAWKYACNCEFQCRTVGLVTWFRGCLTSRGLIMALQPSKRIMYSVPFILRLRFTDRQIGVSQVFIRQ